MTDTTHTVLIVDDNPSASYVKSRLLSRQGYRVLEAANAKESLTLAAATRPDLVLLDINLPDLSGFEVCRQLKSRAETRFIKVLHTSAARISARDRVKGLEAGADAYLIEPAEEEELLGTVGALLKLADQERDNRRLIERLAHTERQLREATEAADCGMWDWDIVTGNLQWFGAHERLAGMRPGGFSGKVETFTDILHSEDRPRVWRRLEDLMARRETQYADEYRFIHADGSVHGMQATGRFYYDEKGRAVRMTGLVQDITERKRGEAALRRNEERLGLLADTAELLLRSESPQRVVEDLCRKAMGLLDCDIFFNFLFDPSARRLRLNACSGIPDGEARRIEWLDLGAAVCGCVARDKSRIVAEHIGDTPDVRTELVRAYGIQAYACHPLLAQDRLIGTLSFGSRTKTSFSKEDLSLMKAIADQVAVAMQRKQGEDTLRLSEERLRLAAEAAGFGSYDFDPVRKVSEWSPSLRAMFGLPSDGPVALEQAIGFIHPEDRPRMTEEFQAAIEGRYPDGWELEFRVVRADGQVRWFVDSGRPFFDERDGARRVGRIVGVVQDLTERKQAEEALRESEVRLRAFAEAVRDAEERLRLAVESAEIGTWDLNLTTGENRWDARCKELFGFPSDAEVSYEMFLVMLHPDDRLPVEQAIARAVEPSSDGSYDMEYRIVPAGGRERWIKATGRALFEERGGVRRPVRFTGTALDVTERRQAETAVREWENRLRLALEAGRMGAWDIDLRTNATQWDEREFALLGLAPGAVEPSPEEFYRRVHPDDLPEVKRLVEASFITRKLTGEFRIVHPDGRVRWLAMEGQILRDELGRPVRMVGINYDVTERKLTEERLRSFAQELETRVQERTQELVQSQERLRALATELNLAELRERKRIATELHDHLQQMLVLGKLKLGQGKRLAVPLPACMDLMKQVDDVLTEALTYTRTLVAELSPPVLRDHGLPAGLKWLGESMKKHDLAVTVFVPEDDGPRLPEDQMVLLFQSVRELLINSWKHAGTGEARVAMEQRDGLLRIEVRDGGAGFDLAAAVAAAGEAGPGGGISSKFGLFTIRERMKAMGGSFDLQSQPGKGTTAALTLPLCGSEGRGPSTEGREPAMLSRPESSVELDRPNSALGPRTPALPHRVRVLLVDDHAMVRQGLRAVLDGYADIELVGEAADGEQAVALADRLQPAVVVMDINMPKMNGIEATASIKAKHPHVHVIGLSVNAGGENQTRMQQAGARLLLTKEAAVEELYGAIHRVVNRP